MGSVSELVSAMAALGIFRVWNAREDEKNYRREEEFVPFRLPPLPQQEQSNTISVGEDTPEIPLAATTSH